MTLALAIESGVRMGRMSEGPHRRAAVHEHFDLPVVFPPELIHDENTHCNLVIVNVLGRNPIEHGVSQQQPFHALSGF